MMETSVELTAEIHFAQRLASNQRQINEKALKKVGKWLEAKSFDDNAFTEDGMLKLWKGLIFYFWNLDKPLIQEDRASFISQFIHRFKSQRHAFLYIDTFFITIAREWYGIDKYRIEKFLMFVRKFLRECFMFLKKAKWNLELIKSFRKALKKNVTSVDENVCPLGLKLHVIDIFMEELAKVGSEELKPKKVKQFLLTFCGILATSENEVLLKSVKTDIFLYLLNQDIAEDEEAEFPILKFDPVLIQDLLRKWMDIEGIKKTNIRHMQEIIKRFDREDVPIIDKEEVAKLRKKLPVAIRKRLVEKAGEELLNDDEDFKQEKSAWKKKKIKKKAPSSDDYDELYLE